MDAVCRCDRARFSRGCHFPRESAPCLAHQAIAPAEASLSLILRGLCSLTHVSRLLYCWSVSTSCSVIMLALTPASSTPAPCPKVTVRDPRDQPSSSPRATFVTKPFHHRVFLFVVFTWGPPAPRCTRSDSRSAQSSRSFASSSLAERTQLLLKIGLLPHSDPRKQPPKTQSWRAGTVPCPLPVASLTCPHIRGTRSLSWRFGCLLSVAGLEPVLKSSVNLLISSSGLAWRSTNSSLNAAHSSQTCPSPWRDWRQRARDQTSCPTRFPERCSSGPNGMACLARGPTLSSTSSLLNLTSMWYLPLLMDPVSSKSSQKTPSIPRCTNVLTSSHRLLLSWSRLQPFNFAVGFHLRRQRQQPAIHQLGLVIQRSIDRELSLRSKPKGVPTAPSPGSTSDSPGSKLKSSRHPDARGVLERNTRDFSLGSIPPRAWRPGGTVCVCFI